MTREELIHHIRYSIDIDADITLTNEDGEEIIKALEQEPCDTCEVGNPCLYCRHEFEPQESEGEE